MQVSEEIAPSNTRPLGDTALPDPKHSSAGTATPLIAVVVPSDQSGTTANLRLTAQQLRFLSTPPGGSSGEAYDSDDG